MYPTVLSYLVYSVPIFQSNCCAQRKTTKQKQKTNDKHGTWLIQNISMGNANIKRPLLLESLWENKDIKSICGGGHGGWELQIREAFLTELKGGKKKNEHGIR